MDADIYGGAEKIITLLEGAGFCAYITGEAARCFVMNTVPQAFCISTSAKPHQIKTLFPRAKSISSQADAFSLTENGLNFEIRTFSPADGSEADIKGFLLTHADFTLNALAISSDYDVLDFFDGINDIKKQIIRCVCPHTISLREFPIRMLRAARFSAVLGFDIDDELMRGIRKYGVLIKKESSAHIRGELNKIIMSDHPEKIVLLHEAGLLKHIMPELDICFSVQQKNKYHIYDVGTHIVSALSSTPRDLVLRWAALFHDIGKPCCQSTDNAGIIHFYGHHRESVRIANDIMHRLHFEDTLIRDICTLVENHDVRIEPSPPAVKHMLARIGSDAFEKLLALQDADSLGKNPKYLDEKLKRTETIRSIYTHIIENNQPCKINDLVVNSRDLIKLGFRAGREIGDTLKLLLDEVLSDPSLNNREYLLKRVKQIKNKRGKHS